VLLLAVGLAEELWLMFWKIISFDSEHNSIHAFYNTGTFESMSDKQKKRETMLQV
jgi:hypothetical protein